MKAGAFLVSLAVASMSLTGCYSIGSTEVTVIEAAPLPSKVGDQAITLTDGTAIVARIVVLDADKYLVPPDKVQWSVQGASALIVPTDTPGIYAVSGTQPGTATLVATATDHTSEARIVVTVTKQ